MLLVLSVVNRIPMQRQGVGSRTPVVLTIQWSDANPLSGGLGPGRLEMRVVSASEEAIPFTTGMGRGSKPKPDWAAEWDIYPVEAGNRWAVTDESQPLESGTTKKTSTTSSSVMSTTLTASALRSGGNWRVDVRLTWDDFSAWAAKTPEYRKLLKRISDARIAYHQGTSTSADFRHKVRKEVGSYLAYTRDLASFARGWEQQERAWLAKPARDRAWLADGVVQRAKAVEELFKKATNWEYDGNFTKVKPGNGSLPCPITLDEEASALVAREFPPIPDRPMDSELLRKYWARNLFRVQYAQAIDALLADDFKVPLELTVHAPGMTSLVNARVVLGDLFPAAADGAWVTVGVLTSDARGLAKFNPSLPQALDENLPSEKVSEPVFASQWDKATERFLALDFFGDDKSDFSKTRQKAVEQLRARNNEFGVIDPILTRVDRALDYLAAKVHKGKHEDSDKDNRKEIKDGMLKETGYDGPGTTGLAILAFVARGHEVGLLTKHSATVEQMLSFVLRRIDDEHYGDPSTPKEGGQPAGYQLGFTLIALGEAIPGAVRTNSLLLAKMKSGLNKAILFALKRQNSESGGWGYFTGGKDNNPGTQIDASVTVVLIKGLHGALPLIDTTDDNLKDQVEKAIGKGVAYIKNTRSEMLTMKNNPVPMKGYSYQFPKGTDFAIHRQPGCLLSEVLGSPSQTFDLRSDAFMEQVFEAVRKWSSDLSRSDITTNSPYEFYALFYAAHLVAYWNDGTERDKWFAMVRQKMKDIGQSEADGSFPGTYGTAMTLIQLMLPLRVCRQELPDPKKP
ncbi:MAG: hypothetical protein K1X67_20945 [Fimbriimonadaceae bacterium]|nr:hypothetical protein [Fimbriimonadaceae bacterium]